MKPSIFVSAVLLCCSFVFAQERVILSSEGDVITVEEGLSSFAIVKERSSKRFWAPLIANAACPSSVVVGNTTPFACKFCFPAWRCLFDSILFTRRWSHRVSVFCQYGHERVSRFFLFHTYFRVEHHGEQSWTSRNGWTPRPWPDSVQRRSFARNPVEKPALMQ